MGSVVGTAAGYWLDGLVLESRWKARFPSPAIPVLGPTQAPVQRVMGFSQG